MEASLRNLFLLKSYTIISDCNAIGFVIFFWGGGIKFFLYRWSHVQGVKSMDPCTSLKPFEPSNIFRQSRTIYLSI